MSLRLVKLDDQLEPMFNSFVSEDLPHFFFFVLDWKFNRDDTEIWLALGQSKIHGMMLIYKRRIVQFRGTNRAVKALLSKLDLDKFEFHAEMKHREIVYETYHPVREYELFLMKLERGEERLVSTDSVVELTSEMAAEIADLMRTTNREFWGDTTSERIEASMKRQNIWRGIFVRNRLVSLGNTSLTDFVSNIGIVATHENHRNKGYATQIVSALAKEILQRNDAALIHVLKDNMAARRVYEKVGFKPYRIYLYGFVE